MTWNFHMEYVILHIWAHGRKKCAIHVPLLFSAIIFFCISLLYETKDFKVWKSGEKTTENLHNEKKLSCYTRASRVASRIFRITSSSSRFAWFELLMSQLGKENVTYLRHRNTSFMEQVTKQILTNMLLNYWLQSALPKVFTSRNVNNLLFASQVMISSKLQTYLDHLR